MHFHARMLEQATDACAGLVGAPIIQASLRGEVSLPSYLAFLGEAYHHVRHTVPLLGACKAALPKHYRWGRPAEPGRSASGRFSVWTEAPSDKP